MAFALTDFTAAFPEFANQAAFPPAGIAFWEAQAYQQLNPAVLGASLDLAAMLFTAHNLVLGARDARAAAGGGLPGATASPLASKSIAGLSVSYDTSNASIDGAGEWNSTSYGQRLYKMFKAFGAGPRYVPPRRLGWGAPLGVGRWQ